MKGDKKNNLHLTQKNNNNKVENPHLPLINDVHSKFQIY